MPPWSANASHTLERWALCSARGGCFSGRPSQRSLEVELTRCKNPFHKYGGLSSRAAHVMDLIALLRIW